MKPSLAHDADPEAYGDAMTRCQGYAPACSDAGECLNEGRCFTNDGAGFRMARRAIEDLIKHQENVYARSWLKLALDTLDHHQFLQRGAFDALRLVAIGKEVRERYGMRAGY